MSRYFCKAVSFRQAGECVWVQTHTNRGVAGFNFCREGRSRDMTPQQDSLSGVIICPVYCVGQRLRVNSITTVSITKSGDGAVNRKEIDECYTAVRMVRPSAPAVYAWR